MKKFIAILLFTIITLSVFTSCDFSGLLDFSNDNGNNGTNTSSGTNDEDDGEDDGANNEPASPEDNAVLVAYKTVDSDYNGAFNSDVGWKAPGMGYIVKTANGKAIAIDGGNTADATPFYQELKKYTVDNGGVVDYWILTHPHGDHVNAFTYMVNLSTFKLEVKNIVYDFPTDFYDTSSAIYNNKIKGIANNLNANIITPKKGDKIEVDGATIDFLYTPVYYSAYKSANAISLIFSVKTKNKKVTFTGDALEQTLSMVSSEFNVALKSDILQMPHHFLCDTGYELFYNYVGAKTLLLPVCRSGFKAMTDADSEYKDSDKFKLHNRILINAENYYLSYDGTIEIEL